MSGEATYDTAAERSGHPADVGLTEVGFAVRAELWRQPLPDVEYPSRRCLLLARRVGDVARPADAARGR